MYDEYNICVLYIYKKYIYICSDVWYRKTRIEGLCFLARSEVYFPKQCDL